MTNLALLRRGLGIIQANLAYNSIICRSMQEQKRSSRCRSYLIRHAQSENNVLNEESMHRRKVDPALTEMGYRQRDLLADFLASGRETKDERFEISQLYTSAMYRSLLTAQPLGSGLNLQPQVWLDLHEKGGMFQRRNGRSSGFNGMTRSAIQSEFPDFGLPDSISESGLV